MTEGEIIDGILAREGGLREEVKRPDGSYDPLTYRGITTVTLGTWRQLGRPATRAELLALGVPETREIYRALKIVGPGFTPDKVPHDGLRMTLADFAANSGPARAIRHLQRVCRVPVSGVLDTPTLTWLREHQRYLYLVNDALCAVRVRMLEAGVEEGWLRTEDRRGVVARAFSLMETPRS